MTLSARNPRVQRLRRLSSDRRFRAAEKAFVVEGPVLVAEALAAGLPVEVVFAEPGSDAGLIDAVAAGGVEVVEVAEGTLAKATDAVTPQRVAAVVATPVHRLADVEPGSPVLVLVAIGDPGNAGTLCRSAEGAGFGAVLFTAGSVDPFAPKCVRASAGSVFRVPVVGGGEAGDVLDEIGATGRSRMATTARPAPAYTEADIPPDVALVLGNEAHGLPDEVGAHVDGWVAIPLAGRIESLNVAMAGTVLCFEVARRREATGR